MNSEARILPGDDLPPGPPAETTATNDLDSPYEASETEPPVREQEGQPAASDGLESPRSLSTNAPVIGGVVPGAHARGGAGTGVRQSSIALDGLAVGNFHVSAGSIVGRSHLGSGTTRQDAYNFVLCPDGDLIVAIADGLGSREHSQWGARSFCDQVAAHAGQPTSLSLVDILVSASKATAAAAQQVGLSEREVAFVAAIARFSPARTQVARVGDVSAYELSGDEFREIFPPDPDGAINIVSAALPADVDSPPEVVDQAAGSTLVLCTDGLAGDLRNSLQVRTWLAERWREPSDAFWMADSLRYLRRGSQDDRTAVVIYPAQPSRE